MADAAKEAAQQGQVSADNPFEGLLERTSKALGFKAGEDRKREEVRAALSTIVEQALQGAVTVSEDVTETIQAIIAELDRKLSAQVNLILHHPNFQKLESAWRGLNYLVFNTETDEKLKVRVLNVSKDDLRRTFKKHQGAAWDQSPLFKKIYGEEFDVMGGHPYGCLVGDYYFDHTPPDVEILKGMSQIAAAAHAPFISAAGPSVIGYESWQDLNKPRDLTKIFETPDYAAWRALRNSDDARYIGLAMPRFLARNPYGAKTNPVDEFAFEEEVEGSQHDRYAWANSAYAMAVNINRSFKLYGWCASIRGVENGGTVENLPVHTFPSDDGGVDAKCPTEISIGDRREAELAKNGFMPLLHRKNEAMATFMGAQSLQKPAVFEDADATANANLAARLPYLFATCRFAHFLKCMVRDKIGSFMEARDVQNYLQDWISHYVTLDPSASQEQKARYPLAKAEVVVEENAENPGYYSAKFFLRPHYQLEGLTVSLRLVSKLPKEKKG